MHSYDVYPLHNKINDHDDRKMYNKSSIQQIQYKVKSGQGGFGTGYVVTKLTMSQHVINFHEIKWFGWRTNSRTN